MNKINSIKQKNISDVVIVAIVEAKEWYKNSEYPLRISNDFVVCQWSDFHDGVKSNIEGKQTIATCKKLKHAELIYDSL